jgi:lipoyl-dependent peroxiredoxin
MAIRKATARWSGSPAEGSGVFRTAKGGYQGNYSFQSRFEEGEGANPEELIGAAHAGCFSMALAKLLSDLGHPPTTVETEARVHLERTDAGMTVTRIELDTVGDVPGMDEHEFTKHAETAKSNCPVSRLLSPGTEITLSARMA